jgi:hypothetical protein
MEVFFAKDIDHRVGCCLPLHANMSLAGWHPSNSSSFSLMPPNFSTIIFFTHLHPIRSPQNSYLNPCLQLAAPLKNIIFAA